MNDIVVSQDDNQIIESVLLGGDLSKLSPSQRVSYYRKVCDSLGLNPLTRPFDYINLKGKLVLYAKKDATDQLRRVHNVSIDDVDIRETEKQFIVKVKGHDKTGRTDVEVGVVNKTDMQGDLANSYMKAVSKGKRRFTLSLCGLGLLDETEIETIPDARPVIVTDNGEVVDQTAPATVMTLETAQDVLSSENIRYGDIKTADLVNRLNGIAKVKSLSEEQRFKRDAIKTILEARRAGTAQEPA